MMIGIYAPANRNTGLESRLVLFWFLTTDQTESTAVTIEKLKQGLLVRTVNAHA